MSKLVALLTDFGMTDTYVGVMKGVMLDICPDLQLVDLTHDIQPQNIRQAAFALLNSYRYFPPGTVFLVVVDPGVGSTRRLTAVSTGGYTFVAPDNGVLSYVLRELDSPRQQAVELTSPLRRLRVTSSTFHGRDVFAPAAAHLANGLTIEGLGEYIDGLVMLPTPALAVQSGLISGEVLHIDHFGSAITSIGVLRWDEPRVLSLKPRFNEVEPLSFVADSAVVSAGGQQLEQIRRTYAEADPGKPLALVGSSGYLELSVNGGSFATLSGVKIGAPVQLRIRG